MFPFMNIIYRCKKKKKNFRTKFIGRIKVKNPENLQPCKTMILFVCFVALRPKSTAMVIGGRSVHLTTLFPGQA